MAECDMSNDNSNSGLSTAFTSSSVVSENVNSDLKKRKTHRLKQRFQVVRKLGQGTYGKVQLAINNETGQEVAIKTIKKSKVSSQQDLVRIRREIQIMSSINHPNIIHIFEVFENKDKIVLVMQYASGGELYDYVSYHKALSDSEARRIFRQVATAIYYCHKNKICHRDLKLENILLDEKGNAKIADFGLSNVFDDKHFLQTFCGSPLYASPEIVRGLPYFGPEVDCWSLGVLLYTLVYGAMPFDGSNFKKLVKQISEAGYFEPPEKSAATGLIHKLLTPDPKERASIIDICTDEWVNQDSDHLLLQVAEDLSNLTKHAVRLDMLLQLAPGSPTEQPPPKPEPSANVEKNENEDVDNKAKRPNEMVSSSSQNLTDAPKKAKKKTKKNETKEQKQPRQQPTIEDKTLTENMEMEKTCELKGDQTSQLNDQASESTNHFGVSMESEKAIFQTSSEPSNDPNINKNENSVQSGSSKNSLKSNESAGSISRRRGKVPISPGLFSVSELKKELEQKTRLIQQQQSPIARRRDTLADTSELKSATQKMKKYQNRSLSLNIQALRSKEELPEQSKISKPFEEIKSETSKLEPEGQQQKPETVRTEFTDGQPASTEEQNITSKTSSSSSVKDDNNKTLAKQIIQKNIAKAKLMEKRQTSIQSGGSQSGETTPLISIENSTVSVMHSAETGAESPDTNLFFSKVKPPSTPSNTTNLGCMAPTPTPTPNLPITSAAPITRSYKKVVFTKDGAKITETGKYYSHEGEDGVTTRVEKKSRITHIINNNQNIGGSNNNNNFNYNNSSTNSPIGGTIQRSDSQSSTGSIDIFDDIFDDHWTGDNLFSNVKSLFNDFFGPRQEPRLSLRSRTESLERTNWIAGGNGPERSSFGDGNRGGGGFRSTTTTTTKFTTSKDHTNSSSNSLFGSQRSLFGAANRQSLFSNSSFSKKTTFGGSDIDDIINSTRSKIDDYRKHGLAKDRFSSSAVAGGGSDDNRSFFTTNNKSRLFDDMDSVDSNRRRVEQWLGDSADATTVDEEDLKDFDLRIHNNYGTIRPQNLRRYARTMTSNDYKSDVFKKVEISNSSSCKVIEQKTSKIKTENLVPRNADVQINFSLDNLISGGGGGGGGGGKSSFIIMNPTTSSSSIDNSQLEEIFSKKSNHSASSSTTVNVSGSGDLKIEEPSSLLEQLRTLGYQKLVNRRLSDSSDTEDLIASSAMADSGVEQQQQQQQQQNKPSAK